MTFPDSVTLINASNAELNELIRTYITSEPFFLTIRDYLHTDDAFFLDLVDQFNVVIYDGGEKAERDMECWLERNYFLATVTTWNDLITHFFHLACHKKCESLWKQIRTDKSQFTSAEIDFFEEIYNQRIMSIVAPDLYWAFVDAMTDYIHLVKDHPSNPLTPERRRIRREIVSLLRPRSDSSSGYLNILHQTLYAKGPLKVRTFSDYMTTASALRELPCVRRIISEVSK